MATNFKVNADSKLLITVNKTSETSHAPSTKFQQQLGQMVARTQQSDVSINADALEMGTTGKDKVTKPELTPYIPLLNSQKKQLEESYHERILGLREYRQQVLASNIANADTPGYKAKDFDIVKAIREGKTNKTVELLYSNDEVNNVDGNTVNLDLERAKFMENAILYEYEVDRVKEEFRDMENLLKNLPG